MIVSSNVVHRGDTLKRWKSKSLFLLHVPPVWRMDTGAPEGINLCVNIWSHPTRLGAVSRLCISSLQSCILEGGWLLEAWWLVWLLALLGFYFCVAVLQVFHAYKLSPVWRYAYCGVSLNNNSFCFPFGDPFSIRAFVVLFCFCPASLFLCWNSC